MFNNVHTVDARGGTFNYVIGTHVYCVSPDQAFEVLQRKNAADAHYDCDRGPLPCERDTRIDILAKRSEWAFGTGGPPICWLRGIAGSGKLAIVQCLGTYCEDSPGRTDRVTHEACLAYQLTITIPALKPPVCDVITKDATILTKRPEDQLRKLIIEPMQSLPQTNFSVVVIVIDALVECQDIDEMVKLIALLADTKLPFRLQMFITSRPEPRIPEKIRETDFLIISRTITPTTFVCL